METLQVAASSVVADIIEKVAFANHLTLLSEATADNDESSPGYLLEEITDLSFRPAPACQQLVDYLTRRLDKPSACVKLKVLNIMSRLLTAGHVSFRRALRGNDASLKMATMFHGQVDPLLGTRHYEQVRSKAQDLLERLYEPELMKADEDESVVQPSERHKAVLGGLGSTGEATGKYQGFGSSPRCKEETVTDRVTDLLDGLLNPSDEVASIVSAAFTSAVGEYAPACAPTPVSDSAPVVGVKQVKRHTPGRAAGGWDSDSDELTSPLSTGSMELLDASETEEDATEKQIIAEFCDRDTWPATLAHVRHTFDKCTGIQAVKHIGAVLSASSSDVRHLRALLLVECFLRKDVAAPPLLAQHLSSQLDDIVQGNRGEALTLKARKIKLIMEKLCTG